jgi:hypothetical protein
VKIAGIITHIEILQDGRRVLVIGNEDGPMMPIFDEMASLLASVHRNETARDAPAPPRADRADIRRFIQQRNDWHGRQGRRARGRKH